MSALFTNDWNSLTYTCLTIKSDVYEAFVNPEESFREDPFYAQILRIYSYIYELYFIKAYEI